MSTPVSAAAAGNGGGRGGPEAHVTPVRNVVSPAGAAATAPEQQQQQQQQQQQAGAGAGTGSRFSMKGRGSGTEAKAAVAAINGGPEGSSSNSSGAQPLRKVHSANAMQRDQGGEAPAQGQQHDGLSFEINLLGDKDGAVDGKQTLRRTAPSSSPSAKGRGDGTLRRDTGTAAGRPTRNARDRIASSKNKGREVAASVSMSGASPGDTVSKGTQAGTTDASASASASAAATASADAKADAQGPEQPQQQLSAHRSEPEDGAEDSVEDDPRDNMAARALTAVKRTQMQKLQRECGWLPHVVLKFTTMYDDGNCLPPRTLPHSDCPAGFGRSADNPQNVVPIPDDDYVLEANHAVISYRWDNEHGRLNGVVINPQEAEADSSEFNNNNNNNSSSNGSSGSAAATDAATSAATSRGFTIALTEDSRPAARRDREAAVESKEELPTVAVRVIGSSTSRSWPLAVGCRFIVGGSEVEVRAVQRMDGADVARMQYQQSQQGKSKKQRPSRKSRGSPSAARPGGDDSDTSPGRGGSPGSRAGSGVLQPTLTLHVLTGVRENTDFVVTIEGVTLGRSSDNEVCIPDREMSRKHARVSYDPSTQLFYLSDVGSTNGTYVKLGAVYGECFKLCIMDHIMVGRTAFSVNRFDYSVCEEIGRRPTMEDAAVIVQDLAVYPGSATSPGLYQVGLGPQTFAGVFDGHGGPQASKFLWQALHVEVANQLEKRAPLLVNLILRACKKISLQQQHEQDGQDGQETTDVGSGSGGLDEFGLEPDALAGNADFGDEPEDFMLDPAELYAAAAACFVIPPNKRFQDHGQFPIDRLPPEALHAVDLHIRAALRTAFLNTDEKFVRTSNYPLAGSTATTALIAGRRIYCANTGDSRTVLCRGGVAIDLSDDHKPDRPDEHARIRAAKGCVLFRRVMGELAVSRAFGDAEFKVRPPPEDHRPMRHSTTSGVGATSSAPKVQSTDNPARQHLQQQQQSQAPAGGEEDGDAAGDSKTDESADAQTAGTGGNAVADDGGEGEGDGDAKSSSRFSSKAVFRSLRRKAKVRAAGGDGGSAAQDDAADVGTDNKGKRKGLRRPLRNLASRSLPAALRSRLSAGGGGAGASGAVAGAADMDDEDHVNDSVAVAVTGNTGAQFAGSDSWADLRASPWQQNLTGRPNRQLLSSFSYSLANALDVPPMVTAEPDILVAEMTKDDEFMVCACDGLYDVFESQEVVDFVRQRLRSGMTVSEVSYHITREAIDVRGSMDNVSVMIIKF